MSYLNLYIYSWYNLEFQYIILLHIFVEASNKLEDEVRTGVVGELEGSSENGTNGRAWRAGENETNWRAGRVDENRDYWELAIQDYNRPMGATDTRRS
jgi:hypothetical protein